MNQEITLSADLFYFLEEHNHNPFEELSNTSKVMENIKTERKLFVDKENFQNDVNTIIDKSKIKDVLRGVWQYFPINKIEKVEPQTKPIAKRKISNNKTRLLANIAFDYGDKIFIGNNISEMEKHIIGKFDVHGLNFNDYLNPNNDSPLIRPKRIKLKKDEEFDLVSFFKPLLEKTKKLLIEEPYPHKRSSLFVLKTIFDLCNDNTVVTLETFTPKGREDGIDVVPIINKIKPNHIKLKYKLVEQYEIHDRTLTTDFFTIDIGKGLNFVYKKTDGSIIVSVKGYINISAISSN